MKSLFQFFFSFLSVILLTSPSFAATLPQPTKDYSADFLIKVTQGRGSEPMTLPGKIYYSRGNERREMEMMGQKSISIQRLDKEVIWVLMPENRMYLENSLDDRQRQKDPAAAILEDDLNMTKLGREKVNGVMTDKYRITVTDPQAEPMEGFLWLSKENIPIRMEGTSQQQGQATHFVTNTTNLKFGRQPAKLFEIPAGYQRLQVPGLGGLGMSRGKSTMQPDAPSGSGGAMDLSPEQLEQFRLQMEKLKQQMGAQ